MRVIRPKTHILSFNCDVHIIFQFQNLPYQHYRLLHFVWTSNYARVRMARWGAGGQARCAEDSTESPGAAVRGENR